MNKTKYNSKVAWTSLINIAGLYDDVYEYECFGEFLIKKRQISLLHCCKELDVCPKITTQKLH